MNLDNFVRAKRLAARSVGLLAAGAMLVSAGAAQACPGLTAHAQLLSLLPHLHANANSSNNRFGYNQGALEQV
jgi:hypothetical protein